MTKFGQFEAANNLIPRDGMDSIRSHLWYVVLLICELNHSITLERNADENRFVACALASQSQACCLLSLSHGEILYDEEEKKTQWKYMKFCHVRGRARNRDRAPSASL